MPDEVAVQIARIDERTKNIEEKLDAFCKDHEARLRCVEAEAQALGVRMNLWQAAQGIFTAVTATIAGYLGTR